MRDLPSFRRFPLWRNLVPAIGDENDDEGSGGGAPPAGGQRGEPGQGGTPQTREEEVTESGFDRFMDILVRKFQQSTAGLQQQSFSSAAPTLEVKQKLQVPKWTGRVEKGESLQTAFVVFKSSFLEYLSAEGLDDVLQDREDIPVGMPNPNIDRMNHMFGPERVKKSRSVWSLLISKVTHTPVLQAILATGSPQKGWEVFVRYYEERGDAERDRLEMEWNELEQGEDENVVEFLARASTIRMNLESFGMRWNDNQACKHMARRLNSSFSLPRDVLLLQDNLTSRQLESSLRQADHERRRSGRKGDGREEETRHALFAADVGRSDKNNTAGMGRGGRGVYAAGWERDRGRMGERPLYCRVHGENSSHSTWECWKVRSQFEQFLEETEQPAEGHAFEGRRTGRHLDGLRHNDVFQRPEGPQRPQPHPGTHSGADGSWSRGRPPPRPPSRGRGPGSSAYPGRHPGGRQPVGGAFEGGHFSGGRGRGRGGNRPPPTNLQPQRQPFANGPDRYALYTQSPEEYSHGEGSDNRWGHSAWHSPEQQQEYPETYEYGLAAQGGGYGGRSDGYGDGGYNDAGGGYSPGYFSAGGENTTGYASRADFDETYQAFSAAGPDVYQPSRFEQLYGASPQQQQQQQQQQQGSHTQHPSGAVSSSTQPSSSSSPGPSSSRGLAYSCMALNVDEGKSQNSDLVSGLEYDSSSCQSQEGMCRNERVSATTVASAMMCEERPSITPCPPNSEKWTSDSGSTSSITHDSSMMFDMEKPEPHRAFIQIGDKGMIPVEGIGKLNLLFHQRRDDGSLFDLNVQMKNVLYVPKIGFHLFSAWRASQHQIVILDPRGTHLMQGDLNFARGPSSDFLYATRYPFVPDQKMITVPESEADPSWRAMFSQLSDNLHSVYDLSLCAETFPGMHLGSEVESVLSDKRRTNGCDAESVWCYTPDLLTEEQAEFHAAAFDRSEGRESAHAVLGPGATPFVVGNRVKSFDINDFHNRIGHLSEFLLRETAKQQGISLTGRMEPCEDCMPAKGRQASVRSRGGGRADNPNDLVHLDFCGPYSPSIGGNFYLLVAVDSSARYIQPYALRRRSEGLAMFKRCVVDMAHLAKRPVRCIRVDNDSVWTSVAFRDFCASAGIAVEFSPPGVQQYNGVAESAIWRIMKAGMAARRSAARALGPGGFSCIPGLDRRGDKLWAESAKWAAEAFNQSGTTANVGNRSPQELYTGKKGPFRLLPFFQRGFMRVNRATKMDDQAVPCHYLNGGDNHGTATVKVVKASTGFVCYTSNVSWASRSSSGGGGNGDQTSPSAHASSFSPSASTPPLPDLSFRFVPPGPASASRQSPPPRNVVGQQQRSPRQPSSPRRPSTSPLADPAAPSPASVPSPSAVLPSPPVRLQPSSPMPAWSPSPIQGAPSPSRSTPSGSSTSAGSDQQQQPQTRRAFQPPTPPAGYPPLTPHAARQLGSEGDPRVPGRTRLQARAMADQGISPPDGAVNTPIPEPSSSRNVNTMGLVSQAERDRFLSVMAEYEMEHEERRKAFHEQSRRMTEFCGLGKSVGSSGVGESQKIKQDEGKSRGWANSAFATTMKWARSLATREEIDEVIREQEPPAKRPDMPLCHASDLRVPKSYKDAVEGEYGKHFRDAIQREVHGVVEAGTFEPVDK